VRSIARRTFLGLSSTALALGVTRPLRAEDSVEVRDLTEAGRRFTLVVPKHIAPGEKVPLVILLHGLGETTDARAGAFANFAGSGEALDAYGRWLALSLVPRVRREARSRSAASRTSCASYPDLTPSRGCANQGRSRRSSFTRASPDVTCSRRR
jgi:hypothetical protein